MKTKLLGDNIFLKIDVMKKKKYFVDVQKGDGDTKIFLKFSSLGLLLKLGFEPGLLGEKCEQYLCAIPPLFVIHFFFAKKTCSCKNLQIFSISKVKHFKKTSQKDHPQVWKVVYKNFFPIPGKK